MVRVAGLKRRIATGLAVTRGQRPGAARGARGDLAPGARAAGRGTPPSSATRSRPALADAGHQHRPLGRAAAERAGAAARVLPRAGLPGAHAARGRPGAPVPLHLRAVAQPRRGPAQPGDRARSTSPGSRCRRCCRGSSPSTATSTTGGGSSRSRTSSPPTSTSSSPAWRCCEHHTFRVTRNEDLEVEEDDAENLLQALEKELHAAPVRAAGAPRGRRGHRPARAATCSSRELGVSRRRGLRAARAAGPDRAATSSPTWTGPSCNYPPFVPTTHRQLAEVETRQPSDIFAAMRRPGRPAAPPVRLVLDQRAGVPRAGRRRPARAGHQADPLPHQRRLPDRRRPHRRRRGRQAGARRWSRSRPASTSRPTSRWARKLEQAGCHVVYGLVGLKTHCKLCLVVRQEGDGLRRYCHVGTGNYNPKTARLYEDLGLLTCDPQVGEDLSRPVQPAVRLRAEDRPTDRLLVAPALAAQRAGRPDRARDRQPRATGGPRRSGSSSTRSSTRRSSTRSTARPRPACRSTSGPRHLRDPAGRRRAVARTSGSAASSAGSSSTRGSSGSPAAASRRSASAAPT